MSQKDIDDTLSFINALPEIFLDGTEKIMLSTLNNVFVINAVADMLLRESEQAELNNLTEDEVLDNRYRARILLLGTQINPQLGTSLDGIPLMTPTMKTVIFF